MSMAMLVLPQADGNAAATYFFTPSGLVTPMISMCSAIQPLVAGHGRGDAQGEALLAEQGVAAVARAVRPDLARLGEVGDVLVVGVARPRDVGTGVAVGVDQRVADRVQARDPLAVAEHVERTLAHAGHDPHRRGDVGGVGELHADVGDVGAERAHGEGHHVHRAALHGAGVEVGELGLHVGRCPPVVGGAGVDLLLGADEGAVLDAGDVTGIGQGEVAVRTLGVAQLLEGAALDEQLTQPVVLLGGAVAPVDVGRAGTRQPTRPPSPSASGCSWCQSC